jgi:hypothetical protein
MSLAKKQRSPRVELLAALCPPSSILCVDQPAKKRYLPAGIALDAPASLAYDDYATNSLTDDRKQAIVSR